MLSNWSRGLNNHNGPFSARDKHRSLSAWDNNCPFSTRDKHRSLSAWDKHRLNNGCRWLRTATRN